MGNIASVGFQLSPLQKLQWAQQGAPPAYGVCRILIEGPIGKERLRKCFETVVRRHESLRTVFQQSPGIATPFQVIADEPALSGPTVRVEIVEQPADEHVVEIRVLALCIDRASFHNLMAEVAAEYRGTTEAEEIVQYADFSEWNRELLANTDSAEFRAAMEHWEAPQAPLRLPLEAPAGRERVAASHAFDVQCELPGSATAPVFLFACWQALLWRLTNQDRITVSYLCDGRASGELRASIGLFASPLPVTLELADAPAFSELFLRAETAIASAEEWQYYCPAEVRSAAGEAIGFEFAPASEAIEADGVRFSMLACDAHAWPFKLSLVAQPTASGIECRLLYDASRVTARDVERLAAYFERTAHAAIAAPSESIFSFELLDDAERREILTAAWGEAVERTDARCFHQIFETQTALTPERVALVAERAELTYAQLNARANRIAHWLRGAGVGPNVMVGLCLERSAEMIVALLGILKAGGAYVPLLPDLPPARLLRQLAETAAPVLISTLALLEKLPQFTGRVLCLDRDAAELDAAPADNPPPPASLSDAAYVLYTSGSTGTPKGVVVRHGNLTHYVNGICERLSLPLITTDHALTFATVSTLGADLGNTSIFPPLVTGGTLAVIGYDAVVDASLFAARNREHPIDVLKITPSNILALVQAAADPREVLPRKLLITGGEACSWDLVRRVRAAGTCAMMNHYGPTEATVGCLTYAIAAENDPAEATTHFVPLGRPLANMQVYVLDAARRPVPAGVPGEICASGAGIAAGYLARAEETAARFIPNPFVADGAALYLTGDRGRVLADGSIEFLGRTDDQVKIRGHRVELAEIEAVLARHKAVQQAVVLLHEGQLAAYAMAAPATTAEQLEQHLRQQLPEYMIPASVTFVERFPLNANGKVDRRQLSEIAQAAPARLESAAPRTATEEQLAAIWKDVLKLERVGVTDNFFELGGHSLLATLVVSRIRSAFEVQIAIRALFEAPTIEALAVAIENARTESAEDPELADLLSEIEELSDEQTQELLDAELGLPVAPKPPLSAGRS